MEDRRMDFEREALISREYEIVVFDTGSTDATAEPIRRPRASAPSTAAT